MDQSGKRNSNHRHGHTAAGSKVTKTYCSWYAAKTRCTNPKQAQWKDYGGRGIKMCERWLNSFPAFLEDMGERPEGYTLDRKDGNKDYELSNCQWSDRKTQNRNSRRVVATLEIRTEIHRLKSTMSQPKIAKQVGVSVCTVNRIIRGISWA